LIPLKGGNSLGGSSNIPSNSSKSVSKPKECQGGSGEDIEKTLVGKRRYKVL